MPSDQVQDADAARADIAGRVARWRAALDEIGGDAKDARPVAERALADAASGDAYEDLRAVLREVTHSADHTRYAVGDVISVVDRLHADWIAERRVAPDKLKEFVQELGERLVDEPVEGARRWLAAVLDALD